MECEHYECNYTYKCYGDKEKCVIGDKTNYAVYKRADGEVELKTRKAPVVIAWEMETKEHDWTPINVTFIKEKKGDVTILNFTKAGVQSEYRRTYAE